MLNQPPFHLVPLVNNALPLQQDSDAFRLLKVREFSMVLNEVFLYLNYQF